MISYNIMWSSEAQLSGISSHVNQIYDMLQDQRYYPKYVKYIAIRDVSLLRGAFILHTGIWVAAAVRAAAWDLDKKLLVN